MIDAPSTSYGDARLAMQEEIDRRIREHQAAVENRRRMAALLPAVAPPALNLIGQGDSWFDYPLPIPVVDQSDILAQLKRLPSMAPLVLSLAQHGAAAEDMLGVTKLHGLLKLLKDPASGPFDAILFSGGGNDLAGEQFRIWLSDANLSGHDPSKGLNPDRVDAILKVVEAGYQDLIIARDTVDKIIPIFAHSYDLAIPNGIGLACAGPWLKPGLDDRGWTDPIQARAIVRQLLVKLRVMLDTFAATASNNFIHVSTQGTLSDQDWANELHPTPKGFAAITAKLVLALRARFPGRI